MSGVWRFSRRAMNSLFETRIAGPEREEARQAAREAFETLERIELELSRFIPTSAVAQIARLSAGESLRIGAATFDCLEVALEVFRQTGGALDVTVGPLLAFWKEAGPGAAVADAALAEIYARVGSELLALDRATHSVRVGADRMELDLGALGKGCAVDEMVERLRAWGIRSAMVHGGTSSMMALGAPPGHPGWPVSFSHPQAGEPPLAEVWLRDGACSGSGLLLEPPEEAARWHLVDPRTGRLARRRPASWALAPSALWSDALSTAFMLLSREEIETYCQAHPEVSALIVDNEPGGLHVHKIGAYFAGKD